MNQFFWEEPPPVAMVRLPLSSLCTFWGACQLLWLFDVTVSQGQGKGWSQRSPTSSVYGFEQSFSSEQGSPGLLPEKGPLDHPPCQYSSPVAFDFVGINQEHDPYLTRSEHECIVHTVEQNAGERGYYYCSLGQFMEEKTWQWMHRKQ